MPPTASTTASTATASSVTATASTAAVTGHLKELRVNWHFSLTEDGHKVTGLLRIVGREESDGSTLGTGTTSSTNTMDVILRVLKIISMWTEKSGRDNLHWGSRS